MELTIKELKKKKKAHEAKVKFYSKKIKALKADENRIGFKF